MPSGPTDAADVPRDQPQVTHNAPMPLTIDDRRIGVADIRRHIDAQICPWCGAGPFRMLPVHTAKMHGVDKWELRDLAGLTTRDPLCSEESRDAMREAYDRTGGARARTAAARNVAARNGRRRSRMTKAGLRILRTNLKDWEERLTPDALEANRRRALAVAQSDEARAKRVATLRAKHVKHPELTASLVASSHTSEAEAKRSATRRAKSPPAHGLVARYKRGCRCDQCREAKRLYRAAGYRTT